MRPKGGCDVSIRVVVVDDHKVVRVGLASLIGDDSELTVSAMVGTAAEALEAVQKHKPDILLLDLRLPDRQGIDIVAEVKEVSPVTRILVLTSYGEDDVVAAAVAAGVDGFLVKTADEKLLLDTIHRLARGEPVLRTQVSEALVRHLRNAHESTVSSSVLLLTAREAQVAAFVAEGCSNREIAEKLMLSEKTVKNHISSILNKMSFKSRAQIMLSFRSIS